MPDFTPETFPGLFTREALRLFQPAPGSDGLTPMLVVFTTTEVLIFALALDGFNEWDTRQQAMRTLGETYALQHGEVVALQFGCEAWTRAFTPEEHAARGDRLIETYPDRQEQIIVMGQLATGELLMASAPLHRRPTGKVSHLGPWTVHQEGRQRAQILEAFWEGYAQGRGQPPLP